MPYMPNNVNSIFALVLCLFGLTDAIAGSSSGWEAPGQIAKVRDNWLAAFKSKDVSTRERLLPAKMAQENLIKAFPTPYTIVRARQFFEFVGGIAQSATEGQTVRLPPVLMQPIVSDDVAAVVAETALAEPLNGTIDLAGPEPIRQDELVRQLLNATGDARTVITDPKALYYGIAVNDQSLTPGDHARLGPTRFADWLSGNT